MSHPRRIPLNPCDYLFLAHHRRLERQGVAGYTALMVLEMRGHPDPSRMRSALDRVLAQHPVFQSGIRVSLMLARPYWRVPPSGLGSTRAASCYRHHVGCGAAGEASLYRCEPPEDQRWDLPRGGLLRLDQYDLPGDRSLIFLRWPHFLMDAEGAQWLLSEMQRQDATGGDTLPPPAPVHAQSAIQVLQGQGSLLRRFRLLREGLRLQRELGSAQTIPLVHPAPGGERETRVLHRSWTGANLAAIQANARQHAPAGPRLYSRYLAACVLRALDRIYRENGASTPRFVIPLPMSVVPPAEPGAAGRRRPLWGNYLVSPNLVAESATIADRGTLGEAIARQLDDYSARNGELAQWAMMWMASAMRIWMYDIMLRMPIGFGSLSSGYSYYGEIPRPVDALGGATVVNLWGAGPMVTPPGWNPVFSRHGDRLNLSLTHNRPSVPDELAGRFLDLIEEEAVVAP